MTRAVPAGRIEAVRCFNRFYTQKIGVLQEEYLDSRLSLTEARVLYELAHRDRPTASELCKDLGLDAGYLSRILRRFERRHLIKKTQSPEDGRQSLLAMTKGGFRLFAPLEERAREEIGKLLSALSDRRQVAIVDAMHEIETALGSAENGRAPYLLRHHQPGDMGWVIHRHGALYASEYGYNEEFEALVARIAADFLQNYDPKLERCWIAERDGDILGSVFLVTGSNVEAKLRLLLVEPKARGLGIGKRLVNECVRFARQAGYRTITLWTQSELTPARHIYKQANFQLVREEPHHSFGKDLVGETWELKLRR